MLSSPIYPSVWTLCVLWVLVHALLGWRAALQNVGKCKFQGMRFSLHIVSESESCVSSFLNVICIEFHSHAFPQPNLASQEILETAITSSNEHS